MSRSTISTPRSASLEPRAARTRVAARILLGACAIVVLGAGNASALTEWRTQVQVTVGSGTGTQFAFDGGLNESSASQTISASGGSGMSEAYSTLSETGYIPTLKVKAVDNGTRAQAVAWGVQGFTNTTGAAIDTGLVLTLTGNIVGNNDLQARVYLFEDENFEFSTDPGTILFESSSQLWPGFESFANNAGPTGFDVFVSNTPGPVSETRQFDFTVDPGDSFYVWSRLLATADQLGEVDAFNTLTATLTNNVGFTPAAVVPEPSTASLFVIGLLGLGMLHRSGARFSRLQ